MKIAIIGAGFAGMTAALDLAEAGHEVVIYEKSAIAGGLASGFKAPDWRDSVETFYHHWFQSDEAMKALVKRLDFEDRVRFYTPVSVMYHEGKFYPFDSISAALRYPGLGFGLNKIRFGFVGLYLRLTKNWRELEKVTAKEWMNRWAGEFVYRTMWEPMMVGKFGERYADRVNMAWLWARISARTTQLGTFEGGFQALIDRFVEKLRALGVTVRFNAEISRLEPIAGGRIRVIAGAGAVDYDRALATCSPGALTRLVPDLPEAYRESLTGLESIGAVVLVVALRKPLSKEGYYWYNLPKSAGFPCLALVEHTNFVPRERYNGQTIVYAGDYLASDHENFALSKEALLEKMIPGFRKINPEFNEDWVIDCWKFSTPYAQPIPFVNHSGKIPEIRTPVPGLYFASMSQVYPYDRGTNYAVDIGAKAARIIMN